MTVLATIIRGVLVLVIAGSAWLAFDQWREAEQRTEQRSERRALVARSAELNLRVLAPGSALACLATEAADAVEIACEPVVFARPDTTAAAIAYTAARLSLLADGLDYARSADAAFAETLSGLRRMIELDRYGLAAHVLATRDGCTAERCAYFERLRDVEAVKANLATRAFETYVARYAGAWNTQPATPPVVQAPPAPVETVPPLASAPASRSVKYDYPSAASIPSVSIMNAEPPLANPTASAPREGEVTAQVPDAKPAPPLPIPPKRPQSQATAPPSR